MTTKHNEMELKLEPSMLNVQTLRLVLERHGDTEGCITERIVRCHHHMLALEGVSVDILIIEEGRLVRKATINNVLSVEEIDD